MSGIPSLSGLSCKHPACSVGVTIRDQVYSQYAKSKCAVCYNQLNEDGDWPANAPPECSMNEDQKLLFRVLIPREDNHVTYCKNMHAYHWTCAAGLVRAKKACPECKDPFEGKVGLMRDKLNKMFDNICLNYDQRMTSTGMNRGGDGLVYDWQGEIVEVSKTKNLADMGVGEIERLKLIMEWLFGFKKKTADGYFIEVTESDNKEEEDDEEDVFGEEDLSTTDLAQAMWDADSFVKEVEERVNLLLSTPFGIDHGKAAAIAIHQVFLYNIVELVQTLKEINFYLVRGNDDDTNPDQEAAAFLNRASDCLNALDSAALMVARCPIRGLGTLYEEDFQYRITSLEVLVTLMDSLYRSVPELQEIYTSRSDTPSIQPDSESRFRVLNYVGYERSRPIST